jgi:hypothetical protein
MSPLTRYCLIVVAFLAAAVMVRVWIGLPVGATLGVLLIGWPLIGTLVTIDDDFPGGWSNPDGTNVPEWRIVWWWADLVLVRGALVLAVVSVEAQMEDGWSPMPWLVCAAMLSVGLPVVLKQYLSTG